MVEKGEDKVNQDGIVVQGTWNDEKGATHYERIVVEGTERYEKGATNSERILEAVEKCEMGVGCQNRGAKRLLGETRESIRIRPPKIL